jgi:hypothetical protein
MKFSGKRSWCGWEASCQGARSGMAMRNAGQPLPAGYSLLPSRIAV